MSPKLTAPSKALIILGIIAAASTSGIYIYTIAQMGKATLPIDPYSQASWFEMLAVCVGFGVLISLAAVSSLRRKT
jgi:hypothetical protein